VGKDRKRMLMNHNANAKNMKMGKWENVEMCLCAGVLMYQWENVEMPALSLPKCENLKI
jgi:hypothetical protein